MYIFALSYTADSFTFIDMTSAHPHSASASNSVNPQIERFSHDSISNTPLLSQGNQSSGRVLEQMFHWASLPGDEALHKLWQLALEYRDERTVSEIQSSPPWTNLVSSIGTRWASLIARKENDEVSHRLRNGDLDTDMSILSLESYAGIGEEISLAKNAASARSFMMAGSGPYPETLLTILRTCRNIRHAVGIDADSEAIDLSSRLVSLSRQAALLPPIHFIQGMAEEVSYEGADIVLVANGIHNKTAVVRRILETCSPGTSVLVRSPILLATAFYEAISEDSTFTITDRRQFSALSETVVVERA